jgi:hypothetical protein
MTSLYDAFDPSNFPYTIRYVDLPRDAVSIRRRRFLEAVRRDLLVIVGAAALVVAAIGIASARPSVGTDAPFPGEFRLGPGNQQPPGVVVPLSRGGVADPIPGEFRLGPGNHQPPGVVNPPG